MSQLTLGVAQRVRHNLPAVHKDYKNGTAIAKQGLRLICLCKAGSSGSAHSRPPLGPVHRSLLSKPAIFWTYPREAPQARHVAAHAHIQRNVSACSIRGGKEEDHSSTQMTLLLACSVLLLCIPWTVEHPVTLLGLLLLLFIPGVGQLVRSSMNLFLQRNLLGALLRKSSNTDVNKVARRNPALPTKPVVSRPSSPNNNVAVTNAPNNAPSDPSKPASMDFYVTDLDFGVGEEGGLQTAAVYEYGSQYRRPHSVEPLATNNPSPVYTPYAGEIYTYRGRFQRREQRHRSITTNALPEKGI